MTRLTHIERFMLGKNSDGRSLASSAVCAGLPARPRAAAAIVLAVAGRTTMPRDRFANSVGFRVGSAPV
ncbi:hypothetical protein ABGB16_08200 [Micromonospora sp. B11E3]|uniref:hypothetical protein n=1 Tax=Micromonospora sp. B11E3 TaxID=3153562 RepID=UPI00325EED77